MRWLNTLCVGGLLFGLFNWAEAIGVEPVVEATSPALHTVAATDNGLRVVTAEGDELTVRDRVTLAPVVKLPPLARPRTAAAISADGKFVAVGDGSGRFTVWQVAEPPVEVATFKHRSGITALQLSRDGQQIAVVSKNGIVVRAVNGSRSWVLPLGPAESVELSADGRQIRVRQQIWDIASRRRLYPPKVVRDEPFTGHVYFSGNLLRDDDFAELAEVKGLKSLSVQDWRFSNASLVKLQAFPALERLALGQMCRFDAEGLQSLSAMPNLTTVEFQHHDHWANWFTALRTCEKLRVLRTSRPISEHAFDEVMKLRQLEEIPGLDFCIQARHVAQLRRMTSLRTLDLGSAQITNEQLESLASLPHLESLSMQIDALVAFEVFRAMDWLATTTTRLDTIFPVRPQMLSELPSLREPTGTCDLAPIAKCSQLKRLRLSGNAVTNDDMTIVASISGLQHLDLTGCTIVDDAGLESLATLKELRKLKLEQTLVSPTGVAKIKKALPKCEVTR